MEKVYAIRYSYAANDGKNQIRFLRAINEGKPELCGMVEARIYQQEEHAIVAFDQMCNVHGERNEHGYPNNIHPLVSNLQAPFFFKVKMELVEMHDHGISIVANKALRATEVVVASNPTGTPVLSRMAVGV